VPDWSEVERLAGEKEVLGFYVTGHPLEKYTARLATLTRHDTSSVEEMAHEAPVTLAGMLRALRVKPSKKGDLWASAQLEDLRGSVELLVFPQAYQQLQGVLKPDAPLLVKGRVRHEENQKTRVVVNEARPLEAAVNGAKAQLRIRVNLELAPAGLVDELGRLLAAHPGDSPVLFELTRPGDFLVRLQPRLSRVVRADDELLGRLRDLCGDEAIRLEKQTPVT
jgi:DNA polymerase-3 subunit alpha